MKIQYKILMLAVIALTVAISVYAADVTGKWKAEFDTQVGMQKYTFDFKVDGDKLTGKASFERMEQKGEAELLEGKVSGDEISFVEKLSFEGNELRLEYKGKIAGDKINFTRKVGDFATEEFVATRVKE
ncbi:MAG TPA: hypothetical protein VEF04_10920 [Blastocatellia bacterium]|nr:hypothetical protein [Blastocatellia bacterium]